MASPLQGWVRIDLLGIQLLLNSSESSLHQLTAMLDCRGLHKVLGWPWGRSGVGGTPVATLSQREASRGQESDCLEPLQAGGTGQKLDRGRWERYLAP